MNEASVKVGEDCEERGGGRKGQAEQREGRGPGAGASMSEVTNPSPDNQDRCNSHCGNGDEPKNRRKHVALMNPYSIIRQKEGDFILKMTGEGTGMLEVRRGAAGRRLR